MDCIQISTRIPFHIGLTEEERKEKQKLKFHIEAFLDLKNIKKIEDTIDYDYIYQIVEQLSNNDYNLMESLAEEICSNILKNNKIKNIKISIQKELPKFKAKITLERNA